MADPLVAFPANPADTNMADVCRTLIRCSPDCVAVLNGGGQIQLVNENAAGQLGPQIVGADLASLWPADQQPAIRSALRRARRGEVARLEAPRPGGDGGTQWWELVLARIDHDGGSQAGGLLCVARDVSALKAAQEKTARSLRLEALGQVTSGVAHDFNNLLTIIMGATEALAQTLDGQPDDQDLALVSLRAAEQGAQQIRRLLAFARRQPLDPQTVDGGAVMDSLQPMAGRLLGDNIALTVSKPDFPVYCRADRSELEAALLNLCVNSRDAMPDGGALTIAADEVFLDAAAAGPLALKVGAYVTFTVADTGVGMSPATLQRALEPFFTTKAQGGGSGLGLSSAHSLARRCGGQLALVSTPGAGATATLYIPRVKPPVDQTRPAPNRRPCAASSRLKANQS